MPFKPGHKDRFQSDNKLDVTPLAIRLDVGVRDQIRLIPGWQDKVRALLKKWAEDNGD